MESVVGSVVLAGAVGAACEVTACGVTGRGVTGVGVGVRGVQQAVISLYLSKLWYPSLSRLLPSRPWAQLSLDLLLNSPLINAFFIASSLLLRLRPLRLNSFAALPSMVRSGFFFWGPVNAFNILRVPPQHRVKVNLVASFVWGVYLSILATRQERATSSMSK